MKQIKIIVAAVAAVLLATSCYERTYVPQTGDVQVTFTAERDTVALTDEYLSLPIQAVQKSNLGAVAIVEFVEGTIMLPDSTTRSVVEYIDDYENGGDIMVTDYQIYLPGVDPEDPDQEAEDFRPSASIEMRVPNFRDFLSICMTFKLVGEHLSDTGINQTTLLATN